MTRHPQFKGYIFDVGGPTANMYGYECAKKLSRGSCRKKRCLTPEICPLMKADHSPQLSLLRKIRRIQGLKRFLWPQVSVLTCCYPIKLAGWNTWVKWSPTMSPVK